MSPFARAECEIIVLCQRLCFNVFLPQVSAMVAVNYWLHSCNWEVWNANFTFPKQHILPRAIMILLKTTCAFMKRQEGEFASENHMTHIGKLKHPTQEAINSIILLYHYCFLGDLNKTWARNLSLNVRWSWDRILIWYCRFITLQLTIVRQRDKLEGWFKHFLVEDKGINPAATSYVDFLCQMHKEIRNLMNWSICGYSSHTTRNELGRLWKWRRDRCVKNSLQFSRWLETAALKRFLVFWVMVRRWTTTESRWLTRRLYDWVKMCYQSFVFKVSCIQHTQRS